jgi:hypothetical protein
VSVIPAIGDTTIGDVSSTSPTRTLDASTAITAFTAFVASSDALTAFRASAQYAFTSAASTSTLTA